MLDCLKPRLVCALFLFVVSALPKGAYADRHCSYARESAFYAREVSADALRASAAACPTKLNEALEHLRNTQEQLDICSCAPAQEPLKQWFDSRPADGLDATAGCAANARAINAAAKTVLEEVEKCF